MTAIDATELLRPGLLEGVSVLVARAPSAAANSLGTAVGAGCAALGAHVSVCEPDASEEASMDVAVGTALGESSGIDMLAVDGAGLFAHGLAYGGNGHAAGSPHAALRLCLDASWNVTRAVVNLAFLPVEPGPPRRIVYLAPAPNAGDHAQAARAGLENLARTLSVEWARHTINVVTIAPGTHSAAGEVAALTAYLASPAGSYFSGCLLDLGGP